MWTWTWWPESRWLYYSYAETLALTLSEKCRVLINSPWYRARYGRTVKLRADQNAKGKFENTAMGFRLAAGVGGVSTGDGGDFIIADDVHKVKEAESELQRNDVVTWWFESMSTRLNDPNTGRHVIIMQRVHELDVAGESLARDLGYEQLILPMRYEPERAKTTSLGFRDPRTQAGELLWPERFNETATQSLEKQLREYGTAGQLQQRPSPRGGGLIKQDWLYHPEKRPAISKDEMKTKNIVGRVRYWDLAGASALANGKENRHGDFTVGILMSRDDQGMFYVEDMERGQWSLHPRNAQILTTAALDEEQYNGPELWVEQGVGLAKEASDAIVRMLVAFGAKSEIGKKDKAGRVEAFAAQAEAGNVRIVSGTWNRAFLAEMCSFPNGAHDDIVDATSGAFNKLANVCAWGFS